MLAQFESPIKAEAKAQRCYLQNVSSGFSYKAEKTSPYHTDKDPYRCEHERLSVGSKDFLEFEPVICLWFLQFRTLGLEFNAGRDSAPSSLNPSLLKCSWFACCVRT